jgi:tRNA-dihydrouridine synthase A
MIEDDRNMTYTTNFGCSICDETIGDDCCDGADETNCQEVAACNGGCDKPQTEPLVELLENAVVDVTSGYDKLEGEQWDKELHIAPMLDYSKREFRKLFSILSTRLVVWTDMVVDETIAHSDTLDDILEPDRDLPNRQVCQIGGNSPKLWGNATHVAELVYGYDEVNLNIDCPSDRVSGEREFGAALMKKVETAFTVLESMQHNTSEGTRTPVSIKCRIGVDDWDNFDFISGFIERLRPVCKRFYLHARKCVLNGLYNARQNRSVPPINYPRVYALCRKFPDVDFWINGGIRSK